MGILIKPEGIGVNMKLFLFAIISYSALIGYAIYRLFDYCMVMYG